MAVLSLAAPGTCRTVDGWDLDKLMGISDPQAPENSRKSGASATSSLDSYIRVGGSSPVGRVKAVAAQMTTREGTKSRFTRSRSLRRDMWGVAPAILRQGLADGSTRVRNGHEWWRRCYGVRQALGRASFHR